MTAVDHIDAFDTTVQKSYEWINDLAAELGMGHRRRAYEILRAYFHAMRDRLPVDEVAQLAAQLPMLLRGVYYEGWDPSHKPRKMDAEEFLDYVTREALLIGPGEAEGAVWATTRVLRRHIAEGELDQVIGSLPQDIRRMLGEVHA